MMNCHKVETDLERSGQVSVLHRILSLRSRLVWLPSEADGTCLTFVADVFGAKPRAKHSGALARRAICINEVDKLRPVRIESSEDCVLDVAVSM